MPIIEFIIDQISANPKIIIFFATLLFGDEMIYFLSFLAGQKIIPLTTIILFSIIGTGCSDIFWFILARSKIADKIRKRIERNPLKNEKNIKKVKEYKKKNFILMLTVSKLFYGTRLLAIFYAAKKEKNFLKLMVYNTIAIIIGVTIISVVVYSISLFTFISFKEIENFQRLISYSVLTIVGLVIIIKILIPIITYKISKNNNNKY